MTTKGGHLGQAWLVLMLAVCFGAALAGVQVAWGPIIEQNKEDDARGQVPALVPGAQAELTAEAVELLVEDAAGRRAYRVYEARRTGPDGQPARAGWVVKAKGPGYADDIEILIGLDAEARKLTGLYVLAQNETPGLGNKISKARWRGQFAGKSTDAALSAVKKGQTKAANQIDAVSGATISSESVCGIVNRAVADFKARLPELAREE